VSKVLPASCDANSNVTVEGKVIPATILTAGKKASTGIVIIEQDGVTYICMNTTDIQDILAKLKTAINKIADTMTDIGTGMTGITTAPPPTLAASVTTIKGYATDLDTIKAALK
jgi:hypothetical protein